MRWGFASWVSDAPTGGNVCDRRLIAGLIELGTDLREYRVDGTWPHVLATERAQLAALLEREQNRLIDSIVAFAAPEVIATAVDSGRRIVVLVHSFMADERWSSPSQLRAAEDAECLTLRSATMVICTSGQAAAEVTRRSGRMVAAIAYPGADAAPIAEGSAPARILSLGTVCERKNQLTLIRALAELTDIAWDAGMRTTRIVLRPQIVVAAGPDLRQVDQLVVAAHDTCYVANTLNADVVIEPAIEHAAD